MAHVLFVCEGNVCRSPFAERVMQLTLKGLPEPRSVVASAGLNAPEGRSIARETADLLRTLGADAEGHRARQLDVRDLEEATLVLTATIGLRNQIVRLYPGAVQYTFAIRQLGRVLGRAYPDGIPQPIPGASPLELADGVAELVRTHRSLPAGRRGADDVIDPYGKSAKVHAESASEMLPALNMLAEALGGKPVEVPRRLTHRPRPIRDRLRRRGSRVWR